MNPPPRPPVPRSAPLHGADLQTQLEALLHEVWAREADWRAEDRIDLAVRLHRDA
jgi:hypothetical protein